ncbi:diacylglycerol kinase family protein [Candidatus Roizmanbacteria bacterium]|nr:diacylglycerol kinase family protein [Candidatus Roizmanbacteria bacterium]
MIRKHAFSFKNAIAGIVWAFKTQSNFKIHLVISLVAITGGFILHISYSEFLVILTLIGIGLAIEALNTAIEEAIDAIHKDWTEEIKIAKDVSAAAMLTFAITAFIIACIIFIPRILGLLNLIINFIQLNPEPPGF